MKNNDNIKNVLIGGAWPYANNSLHLGHLAALISGDFLKRYHELLGDNVIYVSGTDCHGTPITERAKKEGVSPKDISERYHNQFKDIFEKMEFSYDLYSKTTDDYHKEHVKKMFLRMYEEGYIYPKESDQPYCEHCKKFESDRELQITCPKCNNVTKGDQCDCGYVPTEEDLIGAVCRECGNKTVQKSNKHLYLALSKLQDKVKEYAENNQDNWRVASKNETQKYLNEGLRDRAVTRDLDWGIDIPLEGFEDKKMYVWIEAVLGYLTTTQKYCEENGLDWEKFWKEGNNNKMYMCHGKDNITFHTIILPALLIAMNENFHLPDTMVATQYLNINSEKISKSKGNAITVSEIVEKYSRESLRYYMLAYGPENKDVDFTLEGYINVHNSDIVNKFGNFVNRTLRFKGITSIPYASMNEQVTNEINKTYEEVSDLIEKLEIRKACNRIMELIEFGNKYYDERKPWIQKKEDESEFNNTIYTCANLIANLSNLIEPIMPETSRKIREYLNIEKPEWKTVIINNEIDLKEIEPLFERITNK